MNDLSKVCNGLTLRCLGAIGLGLVIVTVMTLGLLIVSGGTDDISGSRFASANPLAFPEDEDELSAQSAQILKESNMAATARELEAVQPAAGDAAPAAKAPAAH
jgi:hypothetical protein